MSRPFKMQTVLFDGGRFMNPNPNRPEAYCSVGNCLYRSGHSGRHSFEDGAPAMKPRIRKELRTRRLDPHVRVRLPRKSPGDSLSLLEGCRRGTALLLFALGREQEG